MPEQLNWQHETLLCQELNFHISKAINQWGTGKCEMKMGDKLNKSNRFRFAALSGLIYINKCKKQRTLALCSIINSFVTCRRHNPSTEVNSNMLYIGVPIPPPLLPLYLWTKLNEGELSDHMTCKNVRENKLQTTRAE